MTAHRASRLAGLVSLVGLIVGGATAEAAPDPAGSTFQAARPATVPSMALAGPYGSPLQLAPGGAGTSLPWEAAIVLRGADLRVPGTDRSGTAIKGRVVPTDSSIGPDEDDDPDDDRPIKPGTLTSNPVKIPTYDWRVPAKPVAPHLTPDVTYDLDSRTTIGVFSDGTKVEGRTGTTIGSVLGLRGSTGAVDSRVGSGALPSIRTRDLGAGITLQYRFGQ